MCDFKSAAMFSLTQKVRKTKAVIVESESEGKSFDSNVENKTKQNKKIEEQNCAASHRHLSFLLAFCGPASFGGFRKLHSTNCWTYKKQTQKQTQRQPFAWREDTAVYFLNYLFKNKSIQSLRCLEIKIVLIDQKNKIRFWKSLVNLKTLKYYTLKIEL